MNLTGLQVVGFQGKNCLTKMASNFSESDFGFLYYEKMNKKYFLMVYEPYRVLEGLQGAGFQGKNCFTKFVSNFSEIKPKTKNEGKCLI